MTFTWEVDVAETVAQRRVESVPLSHLSIEVGHLYFEEFAGGPDALSAYFARVAPWVEAVRQRCRALVPSGRPRISTCFLIDDYFTRFSSPAEVLPQLAVAAAANDLVIDYIARESACAVADGVPLAELVLDRLVPDPEPGTTGVRPPTTVTGWLCNGQRSPGQPDGQALAPSRQWRPPAENGAVNHSIFVDAELWNEVNGTRRWSCPFLAAVWQLLRLGLLRQHGAAVAAPAEVGRLPDDWDEMPAIVRMNPTAHPFSAYRTFSVLAHRFLPIEVAVRTILQQVTVEQAVTEQILSRSTAEGIDARDELWQRIEYLFVFVSG